MHANYPIIKYLKKKLVILENADRITIQLAVINNQVGEVAEWSKAAVLKTVEG